MKSSTSAVPLVLGVPPIETDCEPLLAGNTVSIVSMPVMSSGPPRAELNRLPTIRFRLPPTASG